MSFMAFFTRALVLAQAGRAQMAQRRACAPSAERYFWIRSSRVSGT